MTDQTASRDDAAALDARRPRPDRRGRAAITRRPGRSLLTALGTVVGVGAFVATTGLASTAKAQVSERFDALAATQVRVVDSLEAAFGDDRPPASTTRSRRMLSNGSSDSTASSTPGCTGRFRTPISTYVCWRPRRAGPQQVQVMGASPGALRAARPDLRTGRLLDQFHEDRAERVAVLDRVAAEQLGINRVDNQPAVFIGDRTYIVIGIIDDVARSPGLRAVGDHSGRDGERRLRQRRRQLHRADRGRPGCRTLIA